MIWSENPLSVLLEVGKLETSAEAALDFIYSRADAEGVVKRWRECDALVVDEVSMLHPKVRTASAITRLPPFVGVRFSSLDF